MTEKNSLSVGLQSVMRGIIRGLWLHKGYALLHTDHNFKEHQMKHQQNDAQIFSGIHMFQSFNWDRSKNILKEQRSNLNHTCYHYITCKPRNQESNILIQFQETIFVLFSSLICSTFDPLCKIVAVIVFCDSLFLCHSYRVMILKKKHPVLSKFIYLILRGIKDLIILLLCPDI